MRMADEIRVFAAKRGVDLSAFTLLPFGGAGAVHAAAVADELGMARILVPSRPGAFSALGLLCTDVVHDHVRSEFRPLDAVTAEHAEAVFTALERKALDELANRGHGRRRGPLFGANSTCAMPARAMSCARLSMACLPRGSRRHARARAGSVSMSATRRFTATAPVTGRSKSSAIACACASRCPNSSSAKSNKSAPRPAADARKGERAVCFDGARATAATLYERDRLDPGITGRPRHHRAVRRHDRDPAGLGRRRRSPSAT